MSIYKRMAFSIEDALGENMIHLTKRIEVYGIPRERDQQHPTNDTLSNTIKLKSYPYISICISPV